MNLEVFLMLLLIVSVLTGLTVEGVKKLLDERGKKYHANGLAGIVAIVLSAVVGIGYEILISGNLTATIAVYLLALVFLSWLCAMVGYDKVVQAISQFKVTESEVK
ncbi:MAG TPA: hypothetical protein VHO72_10685 [Bacteroidales bacterium]|nr:hypothetical protein [Bacteroidales bacterium]